MEKEIIGKGAKVVETEPQKSKKDIFFDNIRAKYPDEDLTAEDAIYEKSMSAYDADHDKLKSIYADNSALVEKFKENPIVANFISDVVSGRIPPEVIEYIVDNYEDFDTEDEKYKEFSNIKKSRREQESKIAAMAEEYAANVEASNKEIEEFAKKEGLTPEDVQGIIDQAQTLVFEPLTKGKFSASALNALRNLINLDEKLKLAEESGYIRGKNEKIVAEKSRRVGDGLPNTVDARATNKKKVNIDPLSGIGAKVDAFEAGGYKR